MQADRVVLFDLYKSLDVWLQVAKEKHYWCSVVSLIVLRRSLGPIPVADYSQPGCCRYLPSTYQWLQAKSGENGLGLPLLKHAELLWKQHTTFKTHSSLASRSSTLIFWVFVYEVYLFTFWIMQTHHIIRGKILLWTCCNRAQACILI